MPTINFGGAGETGPSTFQEAGPEQDVQVPTSAGNVAFTGGVFLSGETNLPADETTVYGTAHAVVPADPSLDSTIKITFPGPANKVSFNLYNGETVNANYVVEDNNGNKMSFTLDSNNNSGQHFITLPYSDITSVKVSSVNPNRWDFSIDNISFNPLCFLQGTKILTPLGEAAVESLRPQDNVVLSSGQCARVKWLGHRTIDCNASEKPHELWPVRIRAGAFGEERPYRDLFISPGHPVLVTVEQEEFLVPIMCLINGTSISRVSMSTVIYWHVELENHDIILANGLPAESFLDLGQRVWFENHIDNDLTNPDFIPSGRAGRCRPVAVDGPIVEAERRRLDALFEMSLAAQCAWPGEGALPVAFLDAAQL